MLVMVAIQWVIFSLGWSSMMKQFENNFATSCYELCWFFFHVYLKWTTHSTFFSSKIVGFDRPGGFAARWSSWKLQLTVSPHTLALRWHQDSGVNKLHVWLCSVMQVPPARNKQINKRDKPGENSLKLVVRWSFWKLQLTVSTRYPHCVGIRSR